MTSTHTVRKAVEKTINSGHKLYSAIILFLGDGWQGRTEGLEISNNSIGKLLIKEQEHLVNSAFSNYL